MERDTKFALCAAPAICGWGAGAISTLVRKIQFDRDVRAVRLGTLDAVAGASDSLVGHALVALLFGFLATVPLLVLGVHSLVYRDASPLTR